MCGICGIITERGVNPAELRRMADALSHRGPDDEGFYLGAGAGLGHRRLSIIDLDGGRQPIANEEETIWIVYNGEIYNHQALRLELLAKGHRFRTRTDTEVIVHLYEELGERCVDRLNGMFAFAIWDGPARRLLLARDRIGQKPLFYALAGGKFLFGSEVKAILAASGVERKMDFEALHHYLSLRFIPNPRTMFAGIQKLPAGQVLVYEEGAVRTRRYWDLVFTDKLQLSDDEFVEGLDAKLSECCRSHLVSDVPVGAFLSGGMDTSTIVALMGHHLPASFKTFAIGVAEQDYNELPYARMVADRYRTEHCEELVQPDLITLLPTMTWHLDEPSDPIAACMFHAARLASRHVKVVMGGDGGDELFAGFDRYLAVNAISYYALLPAGLREMLIGPVIQSVPDSFTYKSFTQKMRWMHQLSFFSEGERYAEATAFFRFSHQDKEALLGPSLWKTLRDTNSSSVIVEQYDKPNAATPLDKMLYADFMTRLSEHTLMLTDRMNMAHGLEARSPFLDHTLVEYAARFPGNQKVRGTSSKFILRRMAARYLPPEIIKRKKQGFMFPVAYWFRNELNAFLKRVLLASRLVREGLINRGRVEAMIEEHHRGREDHHVRLWMLLSLEVWFQLYMEQRGRDDVGRYLAERL